MLISTTAARLTLAALVATGIAACGGGHAFTPGQADAQAACTGAGSQAAVAAARAAAKNPAFSTLAADETALEASDSTQAASLNDGSGDATAVAAGIDIASPARQKVIADCVSLGLRVTPN